MPCPPVAVLSDIHSNLHALDAVCADLDRLAIQDVVCLGDIVGYAAFPDECASRVRERGWPSVLGNHDAAVGNPVALREMNDTAGAGIRWSERQMSEENRAWLANLPGRITRTREVFTHASLFAPEEWLYLLDVESALLHFFRQRAPVCFIGHTHRPMILSWQRTAGLMAHVPGSGRIPLPARGKVTVNVGSVGQPRDGDPRACYVLYYPTSNEVEYRRVPYDIRSAQQAIREARLPSFTGRRLLGGA